MAKKDFDKYYVDYAKIYHKALDELENYGVLAKDHLMSEEDLKNAKQFLDPVFETWNFLTYVKYLLDKPNKNSKKKKYERCYQDKIQDNQYKEETLKENSNNTINDFKKEFTR